MSKARGRAAERNREKVILAAEAHFEINGIRQASMAEIADAVGVVRATLYRMFSSREALFEAILDQRFSRMMEISHSEINNYDNLEEALIYISCKSIECTQNDKIFLEIISSEYNKDIADYFIINTPKLRLQYSNIWNDRFAQARIDGELKSSLSNERLIEGMRNVVNLVLLRNDMNHEEKIQFFKDFLIPVALRREAALP